MNRDEKVATIEELVIRGNNALNGGRLTEALEWYDTAREADPMSPTVLYNRGLCLQKLGKNSEAEEEYRRVLSLAPDCAEAHTNLGNLLALGGCLSESLEHYRAAAAIDPGSGAVLNNLGNAHAEAGDLVSAIDLFRKALEIEPFDPLTRSNLIMTLEYSPETDRDSLFKEARAYQDSLCAGLPRRFNHKNIPDPERRLRIGYVSPDLKRHPVGFHLLPALSHHDKSLYEVFCYSDTLKTDELTEELRACADEWREIVGRTDEEVEKEILCDGIDILVDLTGHTAFNRLLLFARKPAPVQATWLGYFNTTGLKAMDYVISDATTIPPGEEDWFTETVVRLPDSRFCYAPPSFAPPVAPLPSLVNGYITFGSFNTILKVTDEVVELWSRVLHAVPASRLLLKARSFDSTETMDRYRELFARNGIGGERLDLRGSSNHPAMLMEYSEMDIALDPFPFSGGLTSCEALWMGVPVITLPGNTPISRQTRGFLRVLKMQELVARSAEQYVAVAKELASDLGRLSRMRSGLRARMAASPLCDGELFARHLEQAFREMWQKWCVARSGEVCIQLSANVSPARASSPAAQAESRTQRDERRLCIGGEVKAAGWEILSPVAGPQVDHVSDGRRLDVFKDAAFDILYAPHVLGRYDYRHELSDVLREWLRVLKPGGSLCISVPDLEILSRMLIDAEYGLSSEERFRVMQMIFGCHADPHDYNQSGFTFEILSDYLSRAGFTTIRRVSSFGFFDDASVMVFHGLPISLNVRADKPLADQSECEALCDEAARLTAAGDMEKGERVFFSVLQRFPDYPRALHALGVIAFRRGDSERALELISRAVSVKPDFSGAWNNLGNVYMALDKFDEAAEAYRRALDSDPGLNVSRRNLGLVYAKQGKPDVAISLLEEAVACDSGFAEAHGDLGALLLRQGRTVQAKEILERAVSLKPDWPECHYNLGIALRDLSRTGEAIEQYRRAVELRPGYSEAWGNLASALASEGRQQEALSCYRRAMACGNGTADTHSGYLMFLNSVPGVTQAEIFAESREWERKYALAVKEQFDFSERSTDPGRKLKIGFVSPDFCRHPVTCFFEPLVRSLDRSRFELFLYADVLHNDEVTQRMQGMADVWYETTGLLDEQVAERIGLDEIDILVDLAGHTAGGRLLLFARKSAPVQATWLGYFNTTGLGAIDYLISDFTTIMPGDEKWFAETVLRLPDSRFCYQPPSFAPEVGPAPAFRNGRVTFGSFNAIRKVGEEVVALWSRVLQAVPGSRLVLKSAAFSSEETVSFYRKLFSRYGIDAERLELRKASHHHAMLEEYGDIDIALDPLPYSGGLTSCEALWMGVPVVTMTGCLPISRQTHGFLRVMDMEELVASTPDQYVAIAASLASDSERLAGMRYGLRSRMAASPLCDGERFARAMENLLRQMWGKWCGGLEDVVSETSVSESKQIHVVNDVGGMTETTESAQEFFESCQKVSNGRYSSERHASGSFAMERGDYAAAETLFREALEAAPPTAALLNDLGVVLMRQGRTEEAVALFQQSIGVDQDNAHAYHNLGKSFYELGRFGEALVSLTTAVAMQEGNAEWFLSLGNTLNKVGKVSDALRCYRKAFRLDPRNVWAAVNQGNLYLRVGDVVQGRRMLEKAAGLVDAGSESHAGILMGLCYLDNIEESRIYEESRKWGDALLGRLPFYERPTLRPEVPGKRIRIGYVSPDFREHSVAFFLEKVLAGHSRERFQVFCYSNVKSEDHVTERFRSHADVWRSISAMDDETVERAIRCDGIDILVDLAGHTEGNRLGVFARRPAPVQVTWLGYPGTTGLRTMDYRLTDAVADPEGPGDLYHTE
ncbi:MAG TPA: tetratricopeptide repeat protein, partial [Geobacteraceae bacterium]|nr:tetratricopeptide repeat protein [Geobacteraceae bacterium]